MPTRSFRPPGRQSGRGTLGPLPRRKPGHADCNHHRGVPACRRVALGGGASGGMGELIARAVVADGVDVTTVVRRAGRWPGSAVVARACSTCATARRSSSWSPGSGPTFSPATPVPAPSRTRRRGRRSGGGPTSSRPCRRPVSSRRCVARAPTKPVRHVREPLAERLVHQGRERAATGPGGSTRSRRGPCHGRRRRRSIRPRTRGARCRGRRCEGAVPSCPPGCSRSRCAARAPSLLRLSAGVTSLAEVADSGRRRAYPQGTTTSGTGLRGVRVNRGSV